MKVIRFRKAATEQSGGNPLRVVIQAHKALTPYEPFLNLKIKIFFILWRIKL